MSWTLSIHGQSVGTSDSAPKYHAFDSDSDEDEEDAKKRRAAKAAAAVGVTESKGDGACTPPLSVIVCCLGRCALTLVIGWPVLAVAC